MNENIILIGLGLLLLFFSDENGKNNIKTRIREAVSKTKINVEKLYMQNKIKYDNLEKAVI